MTARAAGRLQTAVARPRLFAFGAGLGLALAQPPFGLWPALVIGWALLLTLGSVAPTARAAFWRGWLGGLGFFGLGLCWIVEPFLVDIARHGWMAPFALVLLSGGLSLFWGAAFWAGWRLAPPGPRRMVALAALIALAEFARANVLTGFPWALPAYGWLDTPVIHAVAWIGPHGLSLLTLLAAAGLAQRRMVPAAVSLAALAIAALPGLVPAPAPQAPMPGLTVRLVQPNAEQHLKWLPGYVQIYYETQIRLTQAPPRDPDATRPDVVIWPEVGMAWLLGQQPALEDEMRAAAGPDARIISGVRRTDPQDRWFNSLAVLGNGRIEAVYDKYHLVPFGEYIPLGWVLNRYGIGGLATSRLAGFDAGPGPRSIALPGLPRMVPLICYEAIFPGRIPPGPRPDWMVQITNDAWFGKLIGPYQHLGQARVRAIEQGLPLARVATTGVSAMIGPDGKVLASLPLGTEDFVDVALPAPHPPTLYSRLGDAPALITLGLLLLGLAIAARRRAPLP